MQVGGCPTAVIDRRVLCSRLGMRSPFVSYRCMKDIPSGLCQRPPGPAAGPGRIAVGRYKCALSVQSSRCMRTLQGPLGHLPICPHGHFEQVPSFPFRPFGHTARLPRGVVAPAGGQCQGLERRLGGVYKTVEERLGPDGNSRASPSESRKGVNSTSVAWPLPQGRTSS